MLAEPLIVRHPRASWALEGGCAAASIRRNRSEGVATVPHSVHHYCLGASCAFSAVVSVEELAKKLVSLHLVVTCQPLGLQVVNQL